MKSISSESEPLHEEDEEEEGKFNEIWEEDDFPFSDNLKDLLNLRMQLYSAAEYFELSYMNDDQKQIVIDTLKDYSIKAILNTVDHLGSVAYKVNDFIDEKVDEASGVEFQVNCIEQRLKTCQMHMDHEGLHQQSLIMNVPRYHKRYLLPDGANCTKSRTDESALADEDCWHNFRNCAQTTFRSMPSSLVGDQPTPSPQAGLAIGTMGGVSHKESGAQTTFRSMPSSLVGDQPTPSPQAGLAIGTMGGVSHKESGAQTTFRSMPSSLVGDRPTPSPQAGLAIGTMGGVSHKESEKRTTSPSRFPLPRSVSLSSRSRPPNSRSTTPNPSQPANPSLLHGRQKNPIELVKSASVHLHPGKENFKAMEQNPSKSNFFLRALLRKRKPKNDEMLYTYLDEYS